jgi:hypothetical protein
MTQAFNLSQFANSVNASGQASLTTGVTGTLPIANGGTNNGSLAVTAGGVVYTDGSKLVNVGAGSSGQVLTSAGSGAPTWATAAGGGIGGMSAFTSNGTFTIPSGKTVLKVTVTGGGGGGGGGATASGAGGGAGGTAIKYLTSVTPGNTLSITIGSGGGGGTYQGSSGGSGGTSSVSSGTQTISTISATGGGGGGYQNNPTLGGSGGAGSGGDLNLNGGGGQDGIVPVSAYGGGGQGGNSYWGGTGAGNNGRNAYNGCGGTGRSRTSSGTGGTGGTGLVTIEY